MEQQVLFITSYEGECLGKLVYWANFFVCIMILCDSLFITLWRKSIVIKIGNYKEDVEKDVYEVKIYSS